MLQDLLSLVNSGGSAVAVRRPPGGPGIARDQLTADIYRLAASVRAAPRTGPDGASVWVSARDPYLMLAATLGCLCADSVAMVDTDGPPGSHDALAAVCPPALVVCDCPESDVARWARARDRPVLSIQAGLASAAQPPQAAREDVALQFFSSGTAGAPKCISIGGAQLLSGIRGVAGRLALTPADTSLGVAPLTHTLGLVTTVLVALASGGAVAFADLRRPGHLAAALAEARPTWCAASPSSHKLMHRMLSSAGVDWPGLRFLRSSAAPITDDLVQQLEDHYRAPVINAYAMTEAPGEIASQSVDHRPRGTVGRPTLCEVEIRTAGTGVGDGAGEIWIRGPNVCSGRPGTVAGWFPTGDIGSVDQAGLLRITGRVNDVINQGGLKTWPPDVEAVARIDPSVEAAVAFPIPHADLGETIGLALVAKPGRAVDRTALRRRLMAELPRHSWPSTIVVCPDIPRSPRGKVQRRSMWRSLPDVRASV